jgi:teichuronic acid biosynthesis glycosyltransferase TuaC
VAKSFWDDAANRVRASRRSARPEKGTREYTVKAPIVTSARFDIFQRRLEKPVTWERRDREARVLLVTNMWPDAERPAYGAFIKRQVDSLIRNGLRCDVVYVRGYRFSVLAYAVGAVTLAARNLRRPAYELVHAITGEALLTAVGYLHAPVVATFRGSDLLGSPRRSGRVPLQWRLRGTLLRQLARLTARTVTVSSELERRLPPSVRARNAVIPTGVDRRRFVPMDRDEARRSVGWPLEERTVLFAAEPTRPEKNHWLAEATVERAARELPGLRLRVVTGFDPEQMPTLMSAADCLLLTSSVEGSPNVVKEALACNLPVVSTDVGDVTDLLAGVRPSAVCRPVASELARALLQCIDPPRRSNGRELSAALDEDSVAKRLLATYERAAVSGSSSRGPRTRGYRART